MPKLAPSEPAHNFEACPNGCGRRVVRALYRGSWISVECVDWGKGNLGLMRDMLTQDLTAHPVGRHQSSYRAHDCPRLRLPKSFSRVDGGK